MSPRNEQQDLEVMKDLMRTKAKITMSLSVYDAWTLLSLVQLATRHPEVKVYIKRRARAFTTQILTQFHELSPQAAEIALLGWDESYDVPHA